MHFEQIFTIQHQNEDIKKMKRDVTRSSRKQRAAQHRIEIEKKYFKITQ